MFYSDAPRPIAMQSQYGELPSVGQLVCAALKARIRRDVWITNKLRPCPTLAPAPPAVIIHAATDSDDFESCFAYFQSQYPGQPVRLCLCLDDAMSVNTIGECALHILNHDGRDPNRPQNRLTGVHLLEPEHQSAQPMAVVRTELHSRDANPIWRHLIVQSTAEHETWFLHLFPPVSYVPVAALQWMQNTRGRNDACFAAGSSSNIRTLAGHIRGVARRLWPADPRGGLRNWMQAQREYAPVASKLILFLDAAATPEIPRATRATQGPSESMTALGAYGPVFSTPRQDRVRQRMHAALRDLHADIRPLLQSDVAQVPGSSKTAQGSAVAESLRSHQTAAEVTARMPRPRITAEGVPLELSDGKVPSFPQEEEDGLNRIYASRRLQKHIRQRLFRDPGVPLEAAPPLQPGSKAFEASDAGCSTPASSEGDGSTGSVQLQNAIVHAKQKRTDLWELPSSLSQKSQRFTRILRRHVGSVDEAADPRRLLSPLTSCVGILPSRRRRRVCVPMFRRRRYYKRTGALATRTRRLAFPLPTPSTQITLRLGTGRTIPEPRMVPTAVPLLQFSYRLDPGTPPWGSWSSATRTILAGLRTVAGAETRQLLPPLPAALRLRVGAFRRLVEWAATAGLILPNGPHRVQQDGDWLTVDTRRFRTMLECSVQRALRGQWRRLGQALRRIQFRLVASLRHTRPKTKRPVPALYIHLRCALGNIRHVPTEHQSRPAAMKWYRLTAQQEGVLHVRIRHAATRLVDMHLRSPWLWETPPSSSVGPARRRHKQRRRDRGIERPNESPAATTPFRDGPTGVTQPGDLQGLLSLIFQKSAAEQSALLVCGSTIMVREVAQTFGMRGVVKPDPVYYARPRITWAMLHRGLPRVSCEQFPSGFCTLSPSALARREANATINRSWRICARDACNKRVAASLFRELQQYRY